MLGHCGVYCNNWFWLFCLTVYRHPEKYTFGFSAHKVDLSWVKIVTFLHCACSLKCLFKGQDGVSEVVTIKTFFAPCVSMWDHLVHSHRAPSFSRHIDTPFSANPLYFSRRFPSPPIVSLTTLGGAAHSSLKGLFWYKDYSYSYVKYFAITKAKQCTNGLIVSSIILRTNFMFWYYRMIL